MGISDQPCRITVASPWSGAGKTTVTLGLMRALVKRGLQVAPFKVGPDFIDGSFHFQACGRPSANLDLYLQDPYVTQRFLPEHELGADLTILEGCMGLFDGLGSSTTYSTAEVSELLNAQILFVIPAQKFGASIVALVRGFIQENPNLKFCGLIVSQARSDRHGELLALALEEAFPELVCGFMRFDEHLELPSRHLGLVPHDELSERLGVHEVNDFYDKAAQRLSEHFDIDKLLSTLGLPSSVSSTNINPEQVSCQSWGFQSEKSSAPTEKAGQITIGVAYDEAFSFYYATSLFALRDAGFQIVFVSPLHDDGLSEGLDALYIGGGYPEVFADRLASNTSFLESIKARIDAGMPVYAECGGYIYLQRSLVSQKGALYNLASIFPGQAMMRTRMSPQFGYVSCHVQQDSWLLRTGDILRGHEFHYAEIVPEGSALLIEKVSTGKRWEGGSAVKKTFGSFVHIDLLSHRWLVERLYDEAISFRSHDNR